MKKSSRRTKPKHRRGFIDPKLAKALDGLLILTGIPILFILVIWAVNSNFNPFNVGP